MFVAACITLIQYILQAFLCVRNESSERLPASGQKEVESVE